MIKFSGDKKQSEVVRSGGVVRSGKVVLLMNEDEWWGRKMVGRKVGAVRRELTGLSRRSDSASRIGKRYVYCRTWRLKNKARF